MFEIIKQLKEMFDGELNQAQLTAAAINELRVNYLGKNGKVSQLMKELRNVPAEDKKTFGQTVNTLKEYVETSLSEIYAKVKEDELKKKLKEERLDISLSMGEIPAGSKHPVTLVREQILDIFTNMGFQVKDGPEIELDKFNFQLLNIPQDHPAREMQDTFYINENMLLRTHTSPVQARTMLSQKPPIRMVCPGKVFRVDDDSTHSPMFQQIEGLVVDEGITLCDLKGLLEIFAKKLFDEDTRVRFRPSYFPFTEPSVEVDVSCGICHGKGCRICKGTGWMEILGAGVVNPKVFDLCGIDSKKYSGLAFGLGLERIAMRKYNIPDMKILFENNTRFLKQFTGQDD